MTLVKNIKHLSIEKDYTNQVSVLSSVEAYAFIVMIISY